MYRFPSFDVREPNGTGAVGVSRAISLTPSAFASPTRTPRRAWRRRATCRPKTPVRPPTRRRDVRGQPVAMRRTAGATVSPRPHTRFQMRPNRIPSERRSIHSHHKYRFTRDAVPVAPTLIVAEVGMDMARRHSGAVTAKQTKVDIINPRIHQVHVETRPRLQVFWRRSWLQRAWGKTRCVRRTT